MRFPAHLSLLLQRIQKRALSRFIIDVVMMPYMEAWRMGRNRMYKERKEPTRNFRREHIAMETPILRPVPPPSREEVQMVLSGFQALINGTALHDDDTRPKTTPEQSLKAIEVPPVSPIGSSCDGECTSPLGQTRSLCALPEPEGPRLQRKRSRKSLAEMFHPIQTSFDPDSWNGVRLGVQTSPVSTAESLSNSQHRTFWDTVLEEERRRAGATSAMTCVMTSSGSLSTGSSPRTCPERSSISCDQCGLIFGNKGNLTKHIQVVHDKERPYPCQSCDMAFGKRSNLVKHIQLVHKRVRPFACTQCDATFGQRSNLAAHMRTVHERQRPFPCELCPLDFGQVRPSLWNTRSLMPSLISLCLASPSGLSVA